MRNRFLAGFAFFILKNLEGFGGVATFVASKRIIKTMNISKYFTKSMTVTGTNTVPAGSFMHTGRSIYLKI